MGKNQAKILARHPAFELAAVCDLDAARAQAVADELQVRSYHDFDAMLAQEKPDTVSVCTGNLAHAGPTIAAARAGVRGVYCEKPMAMCMAEARAMVTECAARGVALVINHQRRIAPDLVAARQVIASGALGQVMLVRGMCAGDILSDGTHVIDSVQWLTGDQAVQWVLGQVHRDLAAMKQQLEKHPDARQNPPGTRFGHVVESGGMGVYQLADDTRVEIFCGDMVDRRRFYQDYEIIGTRGRLWRTGDQAKPNLFISDADGGPLRTAPGQSNWFWQPQACAEGARAEWRAVELPPASEPNAISAGYTGFAKMIHDGAAHPMSGAIALRGFEVVMAIYESARLHKKITLPLQQERFPLEIMVEEGIV